MLLDRFTGKKLNLTNLPEEIISGRYQVEQHPLQYQRRFELEAGQLLLNEGSGRWHCGPASGTYFQPEYRTAEADTSAALEALLSDTVSDIATRFNSSSPADFRSISPLLPPTVLGRSEMQPLESLLLEVFQAGHLYEIAYRPRLELIQREELVQTGRAKRLSNKAPDYLAAHSEDWQSRTFTGILPKRVITRLNEDNYDIYENRVFARLIDHLDNYLTSRLREIEQLAGIFDSALSYSVGSDLYWKIGKNICSMWGQSFSDDDLEQAASSSKATLENLRFLLREVRSLRQSKLYQAIPRNVNIGSQLRITNVLAHDQHYRHLIRLWDCWVKTQERTELEQDEKIRLAQYRAQLYSDYVELVVYHALEAIGLAPTDFNTALVVEKAGLEVTLTSQHATLIVTPVFADLHGANLPAEAHTSHSEQRLLVSPLAPAKAGQRRPDEFNCPTFQSTVETVTASPLELFSVEDLAMALQRWYLKGLVNRYGQTVEVSRSILGSINMTNARVENGFIKVLAPLDSGWATQFEQDLHQLTQKTGIRLSPDEVESAKRNLMSAHTDLLRLSRCPECAEAVTRFAPREHDCFEAKCNCNATWGIYRRRDGSKTFQLTPSNGEPDIYLGRFKEEILLHDTALVGA
ncbi:DUF2357 domain-containing protein [Ferrimonas balearica]|uniref:DUF2357 domain-containing protein n=1 Tax=Ferrimonas balearica TaxID=44012 RepID=UPI001F1BD7CA|nr:DUF2357 domain-containing protein [Ferrimonas balearica]MBY6093958.1 hypothetical protein [Ferrimonas balearica]